MPYCESCLKRNLAFLFVKQRFTNCRQNFVSHDAALMRQVLEGNNLSSVYRAFFGLANLDRADAVQRGDGARRRAGTDAIEHVLQFTEVTILTAETKRLRVLALLEHFQRVRAANNVKIRRRVFEYGGIGHVKTKPLGHRPASLGADGRAGSDLILREDVIDRAAHFAETSGEDAEGAPETELDEVGVVNVQIQQRAAGTLAVEEEFLSPGRRLRDSPKTRGQNSAVSFGVDGLFQPNPLGPEAQAHGGH